MTARERMRRLRDRVRRGRMVVSVEADDVALQEALVSSGLLDPMEDENPSKVREAFQRWVDELLSRYA